MHLLSKKYKVGDRIKFSTITREGKTTQTRVIVEIHPTYGVGVRFNGWNPYWLYNSRLDKILAHESQK